MTESPLEGLYFPYANLRSLRSLNTAVIYFDKLSVMDPNFSFCHDTSSSAPVEYLEEYIECLTGDKKEYASRVQLLVKEGLLEVVDPRDSFSKAGNLIVDSVRKDIRDSQFLEVCQPLMHLSWVISAAKLPGDADLLLRDLLVTVPPPQVSLEDLLRDVRDRMVEMTYSYDPCASEGGFPIMPIRPGIGPERAVWPGDDVIRPVQSETFDEVASRNVVVPFVLGESIMLTHALAATTLRKAIPFSDGNFHFSAMNAKITAAKNDRQFQQFLEDELHISAYKGAALTEEVFNASVPSLEHIETEEILRFKEKRAETIEDFKIQMRKLASAIQVNPWDKEFRKHAAAAIQTEVRPALNELKKEINRYGREFWLDALKTGATTAPIPIVGSIWAGIPPELALAIGLGVSGLTFLIEKTLARKSISANGFSVLLDVNALPAAE